MIVVGLSADPFVDENDYLDESIVGFAAAFGFISGLFVSFAA